MNVDIRTLATVLGITNVIQVVVIFLQYSVNKNYRGIGWFALGYGSMALGFLSYVTWDVSSVSPISINSTNILLVSAFALLYIGFMRFLDKKENRWIVVSIFAVFLLSQFYYTYVNDDINGRTAIRSGTVAIFSLLTAYSLYVHKNGFITVSANFTAVAFLIQGCFLAFYSVAALIFVPVGSISNLFTPTLSQALVYLVSLINTNLWMFGLIIMINQRLNGELKEAKEHIELIFNTGPDVAVISRLRDGVIVNVNAGFTNLSGFTRDETIGKSSLDINIWENTADREKIVDELAMNGFVDNFEAVFLRNDGSQFFGIMSAKIIMLENVPHIVSIIRDIAERKRAEDQLRQNEEKYRKLFADAPLMYVITRNEQGLPFISDCNELFIRSVGFAREDVIGKPLADFYSPESRARLFEGGYARALAGEFVMGERELVTRDGSLIQTFLYTKPETDQLGNVTGTQAMFVDITATRKAEEAQRRLATAIDQATEGVIVTDTDGNIQYVNPAICSMTGYSPEELVGSNPRILKSGEHDSIFYKQLWDTIKSGATWSGRFINRKKTGQTYYEDATISPVKDTSGKIVNFVAVSRDITEHLELSKQLQQAQKMEAVGALAGGVAHDFNNLLQIVLGYSEFMLQRKKEGEKDYADLQKVIQAGNSGTDLVKRLLMFSRKAESQPKPINLNEQVGQLTKMLTRTIPQMIKIEMALAPDLAKINADPTQMDQVLMNLAVNARDAMHDEGKLTIETANVILDEEYCKAHVGIEPGSYVELSVSDTGQGTDAETLEHIFEPFFTTKEKGKGTGLGLFTVYGIVKQHNGSIDCESEIGQGTTFKIYFPAIQSHQEASESIIEKAVPQGGTETILLVDDEESVRDMIGSILVRAGYTVITACDGKEALDLYKDEAGSISLVLLDLIMPEMGGQKCLEELLNIEPGTKILIATGYDQYSDVTERAIASGAMGSIHKPYSLNSILATVREILDRD